MPVCLFDRFKAYFPHHWNHLLDKRSRRHAHLLKYGEISDGWTPPDCADDRSGNYPYAALADRNKSTDSIIFLLRNAHRDRLPFPPHLNHCLRAKHSLLMPAMDEGTGPTSKQI